MPKIKNYILVEFPFKKLSGDKECNPVCERHSDIFTALQWNLWGWKHKVFISFSNSLNLRLVLLWDNRQLVNE